MMRTSRTKPPAFRGPFRHVLIPSDLTARTRAALDVVDALALPAASRITLLHVVETIDGLSSRELKPFYSRLKKKARTTLSTLATGVRTTPIEVAVIEGRRADSIVSFAAANGVDLIVLASHRVNPSMVNRDWGSISYKVSILAECPVLLVK